MATYTYYGFDLVTGDIITEIPLRGASPSWQVNDPGDLGGGTVSLTSLDATRRADVRAATVPYKTGIAVDRDNVIIWSGIVTGRRYTSSGRALALTVPGLLAYWRRRTIYENLTWSGVDQFQIVSDLLAFGGAPTVPLVVDVPASGVLRDRTVAGSDLKDALSEVLEIADNINGYELAASTAWDTTPGVQGVVHSLRIASPYLGRRDTGLGDLLTLEYTSGDQGPGNVRSYEWPEDGDQFATDVYGTSTTSDGVAITASGSNAALLASGFPRVGLTRQWSNITDTDTIEGHVAQALADAAGYQDAPTFSVLDDGETAAGTWSVGDDIRVRITDPYRFPTAPGVLEPGLDMSLRLSAATLDPVAGTVSMTMFGFTEGVE